MLRNLFHLPQNGPTIAEIRPAELNQRIKQHDRMLLLDVRSPEEYAQDGHITGSRLLPLPMLATRLDELPRDMPIVCVCRSGNRSRVACEMLLRHGFHDVTNLVGGMMAWKQVVK